MNGSPVLPRMLQPNQLKRLNEHLVDTTGCFAFLKTDQVLFSSEPQQWQDAYTVFGVGLYAVYHDYGCNFLSILLSDDFCPDALPKPDKHRTHVRVLNENIRTNLAHGILYPHERAILQHKLFGYYLPNDSRVSDTWPDYVNQLTEQDWMQIVQRLVRDSDALYDYLWSWGKERAKDPDYLPELQERFVTYKDWFAYSFDDRVCRPLLVDNGIRQREIRQYTNSNNDQTAPIDRWRQQLIEAYRNGKKHPEKLCDELEQCIKREFEKHGQSSIDIAAKFGF